MDAGIELYNASCEALQQMKSMYYNGEWFSPREKIDVLDTALKQYEKELLTEMDRSEFEKWAKEKSLSTMVHREYVDPYTLLAWQAWQARGML